jgi:hypothetical protein
VALSPDSRTAVSASDDGTLRVWDLDESKEPSCLRGHNNWVNAVAVSPDGRHAISGSTDATARVWDLQSGQELRVLTGHIDTVWDVAITPDGKRALTASADGSLGVWDLSTGERLRTLRGHTTRVNQVWVTPEGRYAVSASDDMTLRLWDLEKGEEAGQPLKGHTAPVRALALSADGRWAVSAAIDRKIFGWDLQNREKRFALEGSYRHAAAVSFTPVSSRVVVSGQLNYTEATADEYLFPFTGDAIHEMLRYGAGNIRRLLQICNQVFSRAFPERRLIQAPLVEATLKEGSPFYFNRQTVQSQLELLLGQRGLTFLRGYLVNNIPVDLAVLAPDGSPRLLIKISEALFQDDEANQALMSLNLAQNVQSLELNVQILLIVLGYTSPDVTPRLTEFVHSYIVYDPESFVERFAQVLDHLPPLSEVATRTQKKLKDLEADYEHLRRRFEELATIRQREVAGLQSSVTQYVQQQEQQKFEAMRAEARQVWAQERRKIEEQIRDVRKQQRKKELDELENLREKAEHSRRQLYHGVAIVSGLIGIIVVAAAFWSDVGIRYRPLPAEFLFGTTCILAAPLIYFGVIDLVFTRWALRELAAPVASLEELDRLARAPQIERRLPFPPKYFTTASRLRHPNPHYRYAGAVNADPLNFGELLLHALRAERSGVVRQALVQQLVKHPSSGFLNRAIAQLGSESSAIASRILCSGM